MVSILVAVLSVLSLHNVSRARSEEDTHLTKDEWYEIGQAADYTAIIAAPVSLLVCVLYAIVRLLENTRLTENMPDTLVRLTVREMAWHGVIDVCPVRSVTAWGNHTSLLSTCCTGNVGS